MNDGKPSDLSVEDFLDSKGYNNPMGGFIIGNHAVLCYLEENGGCSTCVSLLRRATQS